MEAYRQKRIQALKAKLAKEVFGDVYQLSRANYEKEMVEGSKDKYVVLHLYQDAIPECRVLNDHIRTVVCTKYYQILLKSALSRYALPGCEKERCEVHENNCYELYRELS